MEHILQTVATVLGIVGGTLGVYSYIDRRRAKAFKEYVERKHSKKSLLSGRTTYPVLKPVSSRLDELAEKKRKDLKYGK